MKKIISFMGLVIIILLFSGCTNDSMDNITIYTSMYPIEYVTKELYSDHSKVFNMYPQGINPYEYKLTDKQITDYGDSDLVIYNGIDKEKDYIVKMLNSNKNLKIIDATNNIEYTYTLDEVWLNPSNILMISQNIKDGLKEYVDSKIIDDEIESNYETLKLKLSNLDADMNEMAENSNDKRLVVQNNELKFLEKYGIEVYSLDDGMTDRTYGDAKNLADDGTIKYIYILNDEKENDNVKKLLSENPNLEIVRIDSLSNITTTEKNEEKDYLTIMNNNIDKLKQELY